MKPQIMKSRFKAFAWHLTGSASVLLLVLGTLYIGWYRWPGWYLTGVLHVLPVVIGVDLALGPLITFLIASPKKPMRELARDIACIAAVQLIALSYGCVALWHGRPLYYTYSVKELSVTQAMDLEPEEVELGRKLNPAFAPHWYSLPRWIWAPLPEDSKTRDSIIQSAITGGFDVTARPRYYKDWAQGLADLRQHLRRVDDLKYFSANQRKLLRQRMQADGFPADEAIAMPMTGHGVPLLAVFDPKTLQLRALLSATS
jgi:hypothetical protein